MLNLKHASLRKMNQKITRSCKFCFTIFFATIAVVIAPEYSKAQRVSGGADNSLINEKKLETLISADQNVLKNAIINYLKSMDEAQIADPEIKKLFTQKLSREKFISDVLASPYVNSSNCRDDYNKVVSASAEIGKFGGSICFDIKALAKKYENYDLETAMIQLAAIALHEHLHHLQNKLTENDPKERQRKVDELEAEAYRLSVYVLLTAKNAQLPSLKWAQSVVPNYSTSDQDKSKVCQDYLIQARHLQLKLSSQKEIEMMWKELYKEADRTNFISVALFSASIALLPIPGGFSVHPMIRFGAAQMLGFSILSINDFLPDGFEKNMILGDPFYTKNFLFEVHRKQKLIDEATAKVTFDWNQWLNGLSLGTIASSRIRTVYNLQRYKRSSYEEEQKFLNKVIEFNKCQ